MHGSVLVVGRVSGQIVGLAGNRHNVYGAGICDKPQWLFDVGFYFWYKGYISSDSLCRHLILWFAAHITFQKKYSPFHTP